MNILTQQWATAVYGSVCCRNGGRASEGYIAFVSGDFLQVCVGFNKLRSMH
jgi:hypothetical protein